MSKRKSKEIILEMLEEYQNFVPMDVLCEKYNITRWGIRYQLKKFSIPKRGWIQTEKNKKQILFQKNQKQKELIQRQKLFQLSTPKYASIIEEPRCKGLKYKDYIKQQKINFDPTILHNTL